MSKKNNSNYDISKLSNNVFIYILVIIIIIIILILIIYIKKAKFTDLAQFQQYCLRPLSYNPLYFNDALYSVPGSKSNPNIIFGKIMLYELNVPSIDIMRANIKYSNSNNMNKINNMNNIAISAYHKQYLDMNTSPLANRLY